jgi:hypothetical protein
MEFKGTKENWVNVIIDIADFKQVVVGVDKGKAICHLWFEYSEGISEEVKANALLISKAPEMLEMLKKIVSLESIICLGGAINEQYICEAEALNTMMYEAKQLIKEATEL